MAKGQSLSLLSAGWCEVNSICDKLVQQLVCKGKLRTAVHGRLFGWTSIGTADRFAMSDPGCHVALFDSLPGDVGALAETVQGLLIHKHIAPAYGVSLGRDQQAQSHVRSVENILGDIVTHDGRPLSVARAINERQVGVCRHFAGP
jgi:hypothetical protein